MGTGVRWTEERSKAIAMIAKQSWSRVNLAATALCIHRGTIYSYIRSGRLKAATVGGSRIQSISATSVLQLLLAEIEVDHGGADDVCPPLVAKIIKDEVKRRQTWRSERNDPPTSQERSK